MKKVSHAFYGAFLALSFSTGLASAVDDHGWYYKADAGGNLTEDSHLKEFFGTVSSGSKVKFDPGARVGFGAGYQLTDWFALEGEVGVMANNIRSITDSTELEANYSNIPFLANVRFQCPHHCRLTPYIGGGAGVAASILATDRITIGDITMTGSAADAVFAYQGFVGLSYAINDSLSLGVEYRYFATTNPNWKVDDSFGADSDRIKFGGAHTHAMSVAVHFRF
jgi:opacity protein-like surface antigen